MKKILLSTLLLCSFFFSQAQLATWEFTTAALAATFSDANVTASDATQVGLGSTTSFFSCNGNAWSPNGWSTSTTVNTANDYAEYTITAGTGCTMEVTGFTFSARRSSSGPSDYEVRSSNDSYAAALSSGTINTTCSGKGGTFTAISVVGAITFRIYGFDASGGGNMRMDDVSIAGTIICAAPVELTSFNARLTNNAVNLDWVTSSEIDNDFFSVEYSTDARNYEEIGQINGAGTTQTKQNYAYTHKTPANGLNYYRLKQIDFDGAFEYSAVQVVEVKRDAPISIFPSQAFEKITIDLAEATKEATVIGVYDVMGRMVLSQVIGAEATRSELNVANLAKGHYFIQLQTGNESYTERFIKMN